MPVSTLHSPTRAFTLIELMVSIFLLLLIMIGVNSVFTATSNTIGTTTAIAASNRDARAIEAVLKQDFSNVASDAPAINIRMEQRFMHRNLADFNSDPTPDNPETADFTNSGTEAAAMRPVFYNSRSHRQDRMSFFTRQLLRRQTGNDGTFIANQASLEQWIWLGHLRLPDNTANPPDTSFRNPGERDPGSTPANMVSVSYNPNNLFAQQWAIGRMAMQLVEPTPPAANGAAGSIKDSGNVVQDFIYRAAAAGSTSMSPLDYNSTSTAINSTSRALQESRYDLAGTSIAGYSQILANFIANPANTSSWWVNMMGGPTTRFRGMPYASRPLTAYGSSQTAPIVAMNCSQFMVEFAGDFVKQDATTGVVTDCYFDPTTKAINTAGQDGLIDFIVISGVSPVVPRRQIRWYGLPRETTGDAAVKLADGDTCPLRDTIRQVAAFAGMNAPIERLIGSGPPNNDILSSPPSADYGTGATMSGATGYGYQVAWGPSDTVRPKLIRITLTLDDPNGRLPDGQTFEYVFAVGN